MARKSHPGNKVKIIKKGKEETFWLIKIIEGIVSVLKQDTYI